MRQTSEIRKLKEKKRDIHFSLSLQTGVVSHLDYKHSLLTGLATFILVPTIYFPHSRQSDFLNHKSVFLSPMLLNPAVVSYYPNSLMQSFMFLHDPVSAYLFILIISFTIFFPFFTLYTIAALRSLLVPQTNHAFSCTHHISLKIILPSFCVALEYSYFRTQFKLSIPLRIFSGLLAWARVPAQ